MVNALGAWLTEEMKKRHMSANQFAAHVGVVTATLTKTVNGQTTEPSLPVLRKLATYTHTPLTTLVALAYPDAADELATMSADEQMVIDMFRSFKPAERLAIKTVIAAMRLE